MLKLLFALSPLLYLALLPPGVAAPSSQAALFAQATAPDQGTVPEQTTASDQTAASEQTAASDQTAAPGAAVPATNPVNPTADSQAHARDTYKIDCAMCHGANGDGKGDLVGDMKLEMKSLRDPATLHGKTDGAIFTLIRDGKGKMPPEGARTTSDDLWNLVILVRSFSSK